MKSDCYFRGLLHLVLRFLVLELEFRLIHLHQNYFLALVWAVELKHAVANSHYLAFPGTHLFHLSFELVDTAGNCCSRA